MHVEAWWALRGGWSDKRNAREGERERSKEGGGRNEGMKAESGVHEKAGASCIAAQQQIDEFQK